MSDTDIGQWALWQSGCSAIGDSRQTRHDRQGRNPRRLTGGPKRVEKCPNEAKIPMMTFLTKVLSDSLGRIGSLKRTRDKSLFPMALGSCGHRITHQLRPINMNG